MCIAALGCLGAMLLPGGARGAPRPEILELVEQVSRDSIETTVRRLVDFGTRFIGTDSNAAAARWLDDRLERLGYSEVRLEPFEARVDRTVRLVGSDPAMPVRFFFDRVEQWNVVAVKPGVLFPHRQVVLGAHYDSVALDRMPDDQTPAPGADDNGSGSAAVLEVARILQGVDLDATVVVVFFGAEELGLNGSRAYAQEARAGGDEIVLMLALDAIGTRSVYHPEGFAIDTIGPYLDLGEGVAQAAEDYTDVRARTPEGGRVRITNRGCQCTDHQPFIDAGYPGIGIFLDFGASEAHHNTSADTLGTVDFSMVSSVAGVALAAVAETAGFPGRSPDFDGDGRVAFGDYLLFAPAFGRWADEEGAARFDLDRDGRVRFSDFVLFAQSFGRTMN